MYSNLNAPTIQTDRLIIRLVCLEDAPFYYSFCSNPNVCKYLTFNPYTNFNMAKRAIENMIRAYLIGSDVNFSIIYKENKQVIGSISLSFSNTTNSADIGYILDDKYWNKSIMSEAINSIIEVAFNHYNVDFITASYISNNKASEALLNKFNFKVTDRISNGFIKNHIGYELVKCILYR